MPARKPKEWLNGGEQLLPVKAGALAEHQKALASLKADTDALRELSKLAADVAEQESHTLQALEAVADRLFAESDDVELGVEFDRLEAAQKRLGAQSELVTKKLFAAAEKLQPVLKAGIAGATRLLSAWRD